MDSPYGFKTVNANKNFKNPSSRKNAMAPKINRPEEFAILPATADAPLQLIIYLPRSMIE